MFNVYESETDMKNQKRFFQQVEFILFAILISHVRV